MKQCLLRTIRCHHRVYIIGWQGFRSLKLSYFKIPDGISICFGIIYASRFNFLPSFVLLRIIDKGSILEMRIWSLLFIQSELRFCIHLIRGTNVLISQNESNVRRNPNSGKKKFIICVYNVDTHEWTPFYTSVFRWYGDVRPGLRPSDSPSVRLSVRPSGSPPASFPHFSSTCFDILSWNFAYDCFTVLQIKFECRKFASIFVGVMPLFGT